jgi:BRCT domain type II-containing protein
MLSGFPRIKQLISSSEPEISMEKHSDLEDDAVTESQSDVITICDRSHMTHQERYEFWMNLDYSANQPPERKRKTIYSKESVRIGS